MPTVLGAETLTGEERAKSGSIIYQGFACSPPGRNGGNIKGNIRVIENLSEQASEVMTGEILVAYYTSLAWTSLFNLARGIILEY